MTPLPSTTAALRHQGPSLDALARALSGGRRRRVFLDTGPARRFGTNLVSVFVPAPPPYPALGLRAITCGIALQAAPTKELAVRLAHRGLPRQQREALRWVEGEAAVGWAVTTWPGLRSSFDCLLPGVEPHVGPVTMETMSAAAAERAAVRRLPEAPQLFGDLPTPPPGATLPRRRRGSDSRLPWAMRRRSAHSGAHAIPVGGPSDDWVSGAAPPSSDVDEETVATRRLGVPYDEWNVHEGRYRPGFVRVVEHRPDGEPQPARPPVRPEVLQWFRRTPDRRWADRQTDGTDLDVHSWVDGYSAAAAGHHVEPRCYARLEDGPRDVATALLLDASASLAMGHGEVLRLELECAEALVAALGELRQPHGVFAFRGSTRHHVDVHVLRDFDSIHTVLPDQGQLRPSGYTRLGAPLRHVTARLLAVPAARRVIISIGDGLPCDEGYEGPYAWADVAKAVDEASAEGVVVAHIGVGRVRADPIRRMFGPDLSHRIEAVEELPRVLAAVHEELCTR